MFRKQAKDIVKQTERGIEFRKQTELKEARAKSEVRMI